MAAMAGHSLTWLDPMGILHFRQDTLLCQSIFFVKHIFEQVLEANYF